MAKDFIEYIDVEGLKAEFEGRGCSVPDTFEALLRAHITILYTRFQPKLQPKKKIQSVKQLSRMSRKFFDGEVLTWGEWFIIEDERSLRGWKKTVYDRRDATGKEPATKTRALLTEIHRPQDRKSHLDSKSIQARIPRTHSRRDGQYRYVVFDFNTVPAGLSSSPSRPRTAGSASARTHDVANALLVMGNSVIAFTVGNKLVLADRNFFIFFK